MSHQGTKQAKTRVRKRAHSLFAPADANCDPGLAAERMASCQQLAGMLGVRQDTRHKWHAFLYK